MTRIFAENTPPGSVILCTPDTRGACGADWTAVRFADGTGWFADGDERSADKIGWDWDLRGACELIAVQQSDDALRRIVRLNPDPAELHTWTAERLAEAPPRTDAPPAPVPCSDPADAWIVAVAAHVLHGKGDDARALVCRRTAGASDGVGAWSGPGGLLDSREDATPRHGAIREVHEETGLDLEVWHTELLDSVKWGTRPDGQRYLCLSVVCRLPISRSNSSPPPPAVRNLEPDKHEDWRWCTADELRALPGEVWDRELLIELLAS